jgi:hypothetical protein
MLGFIACGGLKPLPISAPCFRSTALKLSFVGWLAPNNPAEMALGCEALGWAGSSVDAAWLRYGAPCGDFSQNRQGESVCGVPGVGL